MSRTPSRFSRSLVAALVALVLGAGLLAFAQGPGQPTNVHVNARSATPTITLLNPSSGAVGASVTITGSGFNGQQGSGTVAFNGVVASVTNWSATSITATVPGAATSGPVIVTQNGVSSAGVTFTVSGGVSCTTTLSAGANVATAISSAAAGATICLNTGAYGAIALGTLTKSPRVTVLAVTPLGPSVAGLTVASGITPNGVTFDGITWTGDVSFNGNNNAKNITIQNANFGTHQFYVETQTYNLNNILVDHSTFGAFDAGGASGEGRASVRFPNGPGANRAGVTISNSQFGPGGCADGVQSGSNGVTIGPGNLFTGIQQASCSEHVDSIQGFGSINTTVTGNFFVNNTVAFGFYDGENGLTIQNNIVNGSMVCDLGSIVAMTFTHNTLKSVGCRVGGINQSAGGSGTYTENIMQGSSFGGAPLSSCTSCVFTHNMFSSGGNGTNNIIGTPTYTGGTSPLTWAGWLLTSGSIGHSSALDGSDMGALTFGTLF